MDAAQDWLNGIMLGTRPSEDVLKELELSADGSEVAALVRDASEGRPKQRKKAATILAQLRGISGRLAARALGLSRNTMKGYRNRFAEGGCDALYSNGIAESWRKRRQAQAPKVLELLHQPPATFDINRTSWTQDDLAAVFRREFKEGISRATIKRILKETGYAWRKARRVLTSPDPNFTEKARMVVQTLKSLSDSDSFYFLDELGPVQVRTREGKRYARARGDAPVLRRQTPRGSVALVGGLGATTNQMVWAYTRAKDTNAMVDIIETIFNQDFAKERVFITWDAVSWHSSLDLVAFMDRFNEQTRAEGIGPIMEVVPLPTSSQFMNVIEGVFNGMCRAVVQNSDYPSEREMKGAISRHFCERNEFFLANPKRAGKKIWTMDFFEDPERILSGNYRTY